jgi:twitching motility protein PilT
METLTLDDRQRQTIGAAAADCPLFRALKPELIPQLVKAAEVIRYEPEEVVLRQGDPSDSFLVVVEGEGAIRVESRSGEVAEIGRVPRPASLGEVGLLLGEPRTATVVAAGPLTVLKFSSKAFQAMFQQIPNFGAGLSAGLAYRLRRVSARVPLPEHDVKAHPPTPEALAMLPVELCKRHRVLALAVDGNVLTLGHVDDPSSQVVRAVREQLPSLDLRSVHVDLASFNEIMRTRAGAQGWATPGGQGAPAPAPAPRSPKLDALLERVVAEGASDLHLSAGHRPHWRIDGDMREISDAQILGPGVVRELLEPVMEKRHREQFGDASDVDFAYSVPGVARFRVNLFRDRHGSGAVLRQIPSTVLSLEQLGLPAVLKDFCEMPKGLVLVTGPTGSGKSSTLAAMIDFINKTRRTHIVTIEDPIEFVHESVTSLVNQREVGGHTTSFSRALRAALREDPDIILVGELRDLETISLALEAANTGHLVLATLHTNSALGAVDRIIDIFPGDQQAQVRSALADVLRGVVAQTLCKKTDGGRLAVVEVLRVSLAVSNLIREGKTNQLPGIMQASKAQGMTLLNDELGRLVEARKVTLEEALSKAVDKEDLLRRFRSGVTLAVDPIEKSRVRVMLVTPGSPGAEAGLQRGDAITEIDGKPIGEMTLDQARQVFRSEGRHQLGAERAGKKIKVMLELHRA